jgi:hypothetical protein
LLSDVLLLTAENWGRYAAQLTAERTRAVTRQLAAAVHTAQWQPDELVSELLADVPSDDPAWSALRSQPTRRTIEEPAALMGAAIRLRWVMETHAPAELDPGEDLEAAAEARLFTAPMVPVPEPGVSVGVLVLDRWLESWAPAFQFEADGRVSNAVAEVNRVLGADSDPWGVASWWLSPHASLGAIPADAVKAGLEEEVLAAACAVSHLP